MNPSGVLKLINERFSQYVETAPGLFRAEARYEQQPLGIYYFDFSQVVADSKFNLTSYLQKNVATDYYQHEGSLQWNFYIFFVLDPPNFKTLRDSGRAHEIELERTFARKFVRDENWLLEDLKSNLSASLYQGSQPQDVASLWGEQLNQAGLGKIADLKAAYTTIVDDYINGKSQPSASTVKLEPLAQPVANGKFLESLKIENFRNHPSSKEPFTFGRVNLIRGVNGSGKTSLLEAIELGICGGIRRQNGKCPAKASLLLKFQGDDTIFKAPSRDAAFYRNIDAQWYGGYYRKANKLCENFGRFNFFDADAGFRLSHGKSAEEIRDAIEALFLGEYANSLETVMQKCREKFEAKQREFTDRIASRVIEEHKIETDLATVKRIKNTRETLSAELDSKCNASGWTKVPSKFRQADLLSLEGAIEDTCSELKNVLRTARWLPNVSLAILTGELEKFEAAIQTYKRIGKEKEKIEKNLEALNESATRSTAKIAVLERLVAYHNEEDAFKLRGFQEAMDQKHVEYRQTKEAASLVKGINLKAWDKTNASISDVLKEIEAEISVTRRSLNQKKRKIDELKKQSGEIKSLIEQIKGMGRHLCEQNPGIKDCPLCGAIHDSGLLKQIENVKTTMSLDKSLRDMVSEAAREEKHLSSLQENKASLDQTLQAAHLVLPRGEVRSKSLKSVSLQLMSIAERVTANKNQLDELNAVQKGLKLRGYTESELSSLIENATEVYDIPISHISKPATCLAELQSEKKRRDNLNIESKVAEKAVKDLSAETLALAKRTLGSSDIDEPAVETERRLSIINNAMAVTRLVKNNLTLTSNGDFSVVHDTLKVLSQAVSRIRQNLKQVEEKDELEKKWLESLASVRSVITSTKTRAERVGKALEVLNKLLNSENKSAYLNGIIDLQREKLVALFKGIHAPQEFDEVHFNDGIFLSRRDGGTSDLTEISTGQRSALALSIFLSMNSSVGLRAPWLIFDDPIVHIDDLNVLSFFDSLRELVVSGNRQMFFATANSKIGNLFARKFDFLGDSFREIVLERTD